MERFIKNFLCGQLLQEYPEFNLKEASVLRYAVLNYLPAIYETRFNKNGSMRFIRNHENAFVSVDREGGVQVKGCGCALLFGYRYKDEIIFQVSYTDVGPLYIKCKYTDHVWVRVCKVFNRLYARLARRGIIPKLFNDCDHFDAYGQPVGNDGNILKRLV